jgi:Protein of unknown function (DUF1326)
MRSKVLFCALLVAAATLRLGFSSPLLAAGEKAAGTTPSWSVNATAIEACSCPMFCQCYFNSKPAAHHDHGGEAKHYCRANLAYRINKGNYGDVKLDGAKFWLANDLGADFSMGKMDWVVVTYDKATTAAQRAAIKDVVGHLFPVQWNSMKEAEADIDTWRFDKDGAVATMDGGKTAEVRLKRFPGMTNEPIVIRNLPYWGAKRHDGFVLMPNEVEAYRVGPNAFEYKGTNGFMITVDMTSADVH